MLFIATRQSELEVRVQTLDKKHVGLSNEIDGDNMLAEKLFA